VTNRKFISNETSVKVAMLRQRVEPGADTQSQAKDRAQSIAQNAKTLEEFKSAAGQEGLSVQTSQPLKANDFNINQLGTGESSREIVRWAFDKKTEEGSVSKEIFTFRDAAGGYFDSRYVVAAVQAIAPAGPATIATIKANPRADAEVKNLKKAEKIISQIQNASDLSALASQFAVGVDTVRNASMLQSFVPNGGTEPKVIGAAFSISKDAVSKPVVGTGGVYVVKPITEKSQMALPADLTMFKRQVSTSTASALRMNLLNALRKAAEVDDFRSRWF